MSTAMTIEDLTIQYTRGDYVVRPIDGMYAAAGDGELVILLGPSGSGKTTLLSCLSGLLRPAGGKITVRGTEVTALSGERLQHYRRHSVGVIFQAFNLIPSLNARENVAAPLRLAGVGRRPANQRADRLLAEVGLDERAGHRPAEMSGGQQQRVAIARALVHDPPMIVADEPTAHLDYVAVEEILMLIRGLASPGRLVVVATHDARFTPLADRVIDLSPARAAGAAEKRTVELVAGEVLFEQGDPSDLVYLVDSGSVEVFRVDPTGAETVLATIPAGGYFGEIGPLLGLPRSASVRAAEPTRLTGMGSRGFRRWSNRTGPQAPAPA
jgi:putative ABC transport system ATP-binding protein